MHGTFVDFVFAIEWRHGENYTPWPLGINGVLKPLTLNCLSHHRLALSLLLTKNVVDDRTPAGISGVPWASERRPGNSHVPAGSDRGDQHAHSTNCWTWWGDLQLCSTTPLSQGDGVPRGTTQTEMATTNNIRVRVPDRCPGSSVLCPASGPMTSSTQSS